MGTNKKTFGARTNGTALGTSLRSVKRINLNYVNPFSFSFVCDETLQLIKATSIQPEVKFSALLHFSYSFEVFQYNSSCIATIDNLFAYVVIYPSLEPLLLSRELLEKFSTGTSAFGLEFGSQSFEFEPISLGFSSAKELPIACYSNMVYADINTKNSILDIRTFGIDLFSKSKQEETPTFFIYSQEAFTNLPTKVLFVAVRDSKWNFDSSFDGSNAQGIVFERSRTRKVISYRTFVYGWFGFGFLDHSTGLFDTGYSKLALQSNISKIPIDKWMDFGIISNLQFPSFINAKLQSPFINLESFSYLISYIDLNYRCCSDAHKGIEGNQVFNINGGFAFLPHLKKWVSGEYVL